MSVLVIAEHDQKKLQPATLAVITAALQLNAPVTVLVAGEACEAAAENASKISGIKEVLWADGKAYARASAENMSALIVSLASRFTHILAPATTFGKNILPRVAALLDVAQISDITKIISIDTFVRPIYAGNALATVQSLDACKVITVRATAFSKASLQTEAAPIVRVTEIFDLGLTQCISQSLTTSKRPELPAARVVVSGGRGLQNGENFKLLEALADRLGAAIGASRAAVDAGFVPNDYQVGQTGKIVAPDLYIAIGISGAIQHLAGMKDSKVIVAINKDPDAPIFQVADYGLVGDLFEIIPQFCDELDKH
jgi:electron transfer flavoprotein alpha subunit